MSIQTKLQQQIIETLKNNFPNVEIQSDRISINSSKFENVDFSSNICFQLSSILKINPKELASKLAKELNTENEIAEVSDLNGYLNFKLKDKAYLEILNLADPKESDSNLTKQTKKEQIMVEFGQPNTHKAFTIGHLKSAITGLSISNLLEFQGFDVVRANYFGDVGLQVAKCIFGANLFLSNINYLNNIIHSELASSLALMDEGKSEEEVEIGEFSSAQKLPEVGELDSKNIKLNEIDSFRESIEALKILSIDQKAKVIDKFYSYGAKVYKENSNFTEFIRDINKKVYDKSDEVINFLYNLTREISIEHQTEAFERLGIVYNRQYPESEIWKSGENIVRENIPEIFTVDQANRGSVILNIDLLSESEKKQIKTFVYITYDGLPTYSAKDLGLLKLKLQEYPNLKKIIITTSVEQADYFRNLFKAQELLKLNPSGQLMKHVSFGWLLRNNKKQSSRMGNSIKGLDVLNEAILKVREKMKFEDDEIAEKLALASLKFLILSHEIHTDINYDPDEFVSLDGFSGIYIMYAFVRTNSILKNAAGLDNSNLPSYFVGHLPNSKDSNVKLEAQNVFVSTRNYSFSNSEKELLLHLSNFENLAKISAEKLEPHLVCHYVFELANLFNKFYSENQVLVEDDSVKNVRLQIVKNTNQILQLGMWLLGIETVEKM